jgi:hypothetical protein
VLLFEFGKKPCLVDLEKVPSKENKDLFPSPKPFLLANSKSGYWLIEKLQLNPQVESVE